MAETLHFRVSSGLKNIIGRELINDKYIAIFELVKNSYDAGAKHVKLATKYAAAGDWAISDLLAEHEFNSMMRARLVNKIVNMHGNVRIAKAVSECADMLPEAFPTVGGKSVFAEAYNKNVIKFRNKLAHVKQLNAQNPVLIGEVNGVEYKCDAPFCAMIRETLIQYGNWFDSFNEKLAESE